MNNITKTVFKKLSLLMLLSIGLSLYGCNGLSALFQDSEAERVIFQFPVDDTNLQYYETGNRAPVIDPIGNRIVNDGELLQFVVSAMDPDDNELVFSASNLPPGAVFEPLTQIFSWTPHHSQSGNYRNILFSVTDNGDPMQSNFESIVITVGNDNRPPILDPIGSRTIGEGELLEFAITAADLDGDDLIFSAGNLPTGAEFDPATQVFRWASPAPSGNYKKIIFIVTDNGIPSASDFETIAISIGNVNLPPSLNPIGSKRVDAGERLIFTVTAADPDGNELTYSASNLPAGASFNADTQLFNWTPGASQSGNYKNALFTVTDNGSPTESDSESITITVGNVNRPPVFDPIGERTGLEGELLQFAISAADPDGDNLTCSASNLPSGASFNSETRVFNWTPGFDKSGSYSNILFTTTDNGSPVESDYAAITITIGNYNRPPALNPIGLRTVQEEALLEFTISATDPDGDDLTYSASSLPTGATFNPVTRIFRWQPTASQSGSFTDIVFSATDNGAPNIKNDSESITIIVGNVNRPPVLDPIGDRMVNEESLLQFTVSAADADGDGLTYSVSNLPSGAAFNPDTGVFSWTPSSSQAGNYLNILFTVTDDGMPSENDSESITITVGNVNRPPVLNPIGNRTVNEQELLEFTITASDPDGDDLAYSANNLPTGAAFNPDTQLFSWTPGSSQTGNYDNILFIVIDNGSPAESDFEVISITAGSVNRPPELDPIGSKTINEQELLEFTITASDPDGDDLAYSASNLPAGAAFNPDTQLFSWTPSSSQGGSHTNILFAVADNGAPLESDSEAITISVGDVNHPPVLAPVGDKIAYENELIQFTITATDSDGDDLVYSAGNLPAGANFNADTRVFSWTPNSAESGIYTNILFSVSDNGSPSASDSETITITVGNVNRPPALDTIGNKSINEGELLQFTIFAADPDGDDLAYSASNRPTGATFNPDTHVFSWTPTSSQAGVYTDVLFTVTDSGSPSESDSEAITITVGNVNRPPGLDPIGSKTISEGELLQFSITATDPDGDDLTYSSSNLPAGANFNADTHVFSWTPNSTQSGSYTDILFNVTDNGSPAASDSEAITISVGDVNRPPALSAIGSKTATEEDLLQFAIFASDPDGDDLTYSAGNLPTGAVFNPGAREFTWTPTSSQAGVYTDVLFTVTDSGSPSESDSEAITITVGEVNRPPVLNPIGNRTVDEENSLQFTITATDPDGDNFAFSAGNLPAGAYFNSSTGVFSWIPDSTQSGIYTNILFTVTDDGAPSESDSESISITVVNKDWWDTSWTYRKEITITELASGGDLNDFQVPVYLDSSNLDFGHVADNKGGDIRFTYCAPVTQTESEISYWIENWNSGKKEASIWVKTPEIPSGGAAMLYMYYNNAGAGAASNLDDTFIKDFDTQGLAALWHMDEGSGGVISDSSGNNNTGTCYGTAWTGSDGGVWGDSGAGFAVGNSLDFDGGSDYVLAADSSALDAGQITIELWFKANRLTRLLLPDYNQYLASKWNPDTNQKSYSIMLDGNDVRFYTSFDGSSYDYLEYGNVSTGTWYHIAATFNGSTKKIFLNGVEKNSKSLSGVLHSGSSNLTIGIRSDLDNDRDFDGIIDEVAIYDRALSAGEIWAHYERRKYASPEPTSFVGAEESY